MLGSSITALLLTSLVALASPIPAAVAEFEARQAGCTAYTIINTRGTGEPQGPSAGFRTMNRNIQAQVSGGSVYNTVYAAGFSQNSAQGTQDILNRLTSELAADPNHCFILEGYSQGAAATTNALNKISTSDARFNAVKGVFLIGNPMHRAGLACNVDTNGGSTTKNVNGLSAALGRIPDAWISKTLDVCNFVSRPKPLTRDHSLPRGRKLIFRATVSATRPTVSVSMPSTSHTRTAPGRSSRAPTSLSHVFKVPLRWGGVTKGFT